MGSIDTLEIKAVLETPPSLVLYSHRLNTETTHPIDQPCANKLKITLQEVGATFWLRSVSREHTPFFGFWTRYTNFAVLVRIKHGTSRRDVTVPCSTQAGKVLLAQLNSEWSNAA